jgi:hypothetical protein
VSHAQAIETDDRAYRDELAAWTGRDPASRDGVNAATVTTPAGRAVPVRDFSLDGTGQLPPARASTGTHGSRCSRATRTVQAAGCGPARRLSAAMLAAVQEGLAVSPMSDVTEVGGTRELLRGLLSAIGYPFLVLRIGAAEPTVGVPSTPRRRPADAIDVT